MPKEDFKKFEKEVSKYIDMKHYDYIKTESSCRLQLKNKPFEDNILETFKEFLEKTNFSSPVILDDEKVTLDILKQKKYKFKLNYSDKEIEEGVLVNDRLEHLFSQCPPEYWLLNDCKIDKGLFSYEYMLYIDYFAVWNDWNKYDGEDESNLLRALNMMKIEFFKDCNELTKDLMFFILG